MLYWLEDTYSGTEWIEYAPLEWNQYPEKFYLLKQIWTDSNYVYAATTDGLNIIDLFTEQSYAQVSYADGFNSVWADETNVYMATPASGVVYIEKSVVSGTELSQHLQDYLRPPEILSDSVRYIHGSGNYMAICTISGVNVFGPDHYSQKANTNTKYSRKCFMTSTGIFYYTTYDGTWRVNRVNSVLTDWTVPDEYYEEGTYYIDSGVDILDIFVTLNTSITGDDNTLFVATTSGIFVIDEGSKTKDSYYTA